MAKRKNQQESGATGRAKKAERPVVVGARVRELCQSKGWTQFELAWRANLSLTMVSRVMREQQELGSGGLVRLAICFETSTDYLCGLTDEKRPRST